MKISQARQLNRFKRSLEFINKHAKDFAPDSAAMEARDKLKDVIARAESNSTESTVSKPGRRVYRSDKLVALNALRAQLGRISRTASVIASKDPDFDNKFEMPDKRRKDQLVQAAHRFIEEMPKVSDKFSSLEMGDADLQKLKTALESYEAVQAETPAKPERSGRAASSSNPLVDEGIQLVNTLDVVMDNRYNDDDKLMEAWKEASTLEVTRRRRKNGKGEDANA